MNRRPRGRRWRGGAVGPSAVAVRRTRSKSLVHLACGHFLGFQGIRLRALQGLLGRPKLGGRA